jgi:hypothetical protein
MTWVIVILAFLFGAAVLYVAYVRDLLAEIEDLEGEAESSGDIGVQYDAVLSEIEAAWYSVFGPVGVRPEQQDESFNKLWRRAGKQESGVPKE